MDELQTLRELLSLMEEHDLDAIKVKIGDAVYELVRREGTAMVLPGGFVPAPAASGPAHDGPIAEGPTAPAGVKRVLAPLTGVFYRSSSPDAEPFVNVGDRVEVGQVLCILEAMKLFNEIQSEYAGIVTRIIPQNGELVTQGQELFWIEP
jgi:acetyl-CoA carboxylase biotin carboxyl carrier protein